MTWGQGRGRGWAKLRERVFARDAYTCQACRRVVASPECDHIVPLSAGGGHGEDNLQTLCRECHRAKTSREANGGSPVRVKGCDARGAPFARSDWT